LCMTDNEAAAVSSTAKESTRGAKPFEEVELVVKKILWIHQLRQERENLKTRNVELQMEIEEANLATVDALYENSELMSTIAELEKSVQTGRKIATEYSSKTAALLTVIDELQEELAICLQTKSQFEKKTAELLRTIDQLSLAKEQLEDEVASMDESFQAEAKLASESANEIEALRVSIGNVQREHEKENFQANTHLADTLDKNAELLAAIAELKKLLANASTEKLDLVQREKPNPCERRLPGFWERLPYLSEDFFKGAVSSIDRVASEVYKRSTTETQQLHLSSLLFIRKDFR
jgi:chromosome segregation ATPase